MGHLRRILQHQSRTLSVLAVIGLLFAIDSAWQAGWPGWLRQRAVHTTSGHSVQQLPVPTSHETPPVAPPPPEPDYHLPLGADGTIPVISRIPTEQKVVFLTLDDGLAKTKDAERLLAKHHVSAPMFLNDEYVREDPEYFRGLIGLGLTVGGHTVGHADLTTLAYGQQVAEICTNAENLGGWLGTRPTLFRPPYGSYDDSVVAAAQACRMRAVVMWSAKANGGSMQYQDGHTGLVPGDIVLMHFRPEFAQDFQAFMDAAKSAGLQPANLDEWLQPAPPLPSGTAM